MEHVMPTLDEESGKLNTKLARASLTNTDRLRVHLSNNDLAQALLAAWEQTKPAERQASMLSAIHDFYDPKPKPTDDDAVRTL